MNSSSAKLPAGGGVGISRQLAIAGVVLSAVMVLLTASLSYVLTSSLTNRIINERVQGLSSLSRQRIEIYLKYINDDVSELAGNSIMANALVDSEGRSAYLAPFLKGYRTSSKTPVELTLYTFQGKVVASNVDSPVISRLSGEILDQALDGKPAARIADGRIMAAYPVIYPATGMAEGVLLASFALGPIVAEAMPQFDTPFALSLQDGAGSTLISLGYAEGKTHGMVSAPVLPDVLKPLGLQVAIDVPITISAPLLQDMMSGYGVIGILMTLVTTVLVGVLSRSLSLPLRRLSDEASRVAKDVTYHPVLVTDRKDEIGQLARTLDTMLSRLNESHRELESRVAERTICYSELSSRLQIILDNVIDGIVSTDKNGRILSMNSAAERIFNVIADNIPERNMTNLISAPFSYLLETQGTWSRLEGRRADGALFPIEIAVRQVAADEGGFVIAVVRDITERKRTEEELRLAASVFKNSNQSIIITDTTGTILSVNPAFEKITGYPQEDVIGQNPRVWKSGLHAPVFYKEIWRTLADTGQWRGEIWNRRKSGELFLAWQTISAVRKAGSPTEWYVSIFEDITDRHEAQRALQEKNIELEDARRAADAASEAKSRFLATMSHELRTPMTGVLGMADLLLNARLPAESHNWVRTLRQSAQNLLSLLNDLLDFSKIEAGKLRLEHLDYNPGNLVTEVVDLLDVKACEKSIDLIKDARGLPGAIKGDPARLRQVLLNLVGNAIKFTATGSVTVQVRTVTGDAGSRPMLYFEIVDTGIGITEEQQAVLFRPFAQADLSTTRQFGGTGLGLVISRYLVEVMGGQMEMSSIPGKGTTVRFNIPAEPGDPAAIKEWEESAHALPNLSDSAPSTGLCLLLAEDNETNRMLIESVLRRLGHDVVAVENGVRAVEAAKSRPFDLVFMDMQMPEMDGPEATRAIRALPAPMGTVPVVALTADALADARERYLRFGLDDYLAKPVDWKQLVRIIQQHAGRREVGDPRSAVEHASPAPLTVSDDFSALGTIPFFSSEVIVETLDGVPPKQIQGILQALINRFENPVLEAEQAVASGDGAKARQAIHSLRGMAAQFGALRAEAICRQLQETEQINLIAPLLPLLRAAVIEARSAVETWMRRSAAG